MIQNEVPEKTLLAFVLKETRAASPTVSPKKLTPCPKRRKGGDKGKEKVRASMALMRAHNIVTPDDLKELSWVSSNEIVNRHIHKLV